MPRMGKEPNPSNKEVDDLIEQIRQAARLQRALPEGARRGGATDSTQADSSGPLDGYLSELIRRSHPRTELPLRYRRFPLTFPPLQKLALRVYNLLTREQRAGNILFRDALQTLQARLDRNEKASRDTAVLTDYVRALVLRAPAGRGARKLEGSLPHGETGGEAAAEMDAFFTALGDRFRGAPELIKDRLRIYPPLIAAASLTGPALDLGCGRGEWLELMRDLRIESIGVEQNGMLSAACRAKNLHVIEGDFTAFLGQSPPGHWRIVTGFHVIEHLGWPAWYDCLRSIHRALCPGGMLILETPNPANLITAANRFYLDPTHRHPLPDALLEFAAKAVGFASVEILPLHPLGEPMVGSQTHSEPGSAGAAALKEMIGPQDYALIARK
jgi:predicted TPR repeat methyltransferase